MIYAGKPQVQNTIQTVIGEFKVDPKAESVDLKQSPMRKVLVIDHQENPNLRRAAGNIAEVDLIASLQVTPYQLLNAHHVVFSKASIQALEEVLKK